MPRVTVYVSDELRRAMERASRINWSNVASLAFQSALAIQQQKRNSTMETAIARLRASKEKSMQWSQLEGYQAGRHWAEHDAEFDELKRLADINVDEINEEIALQVLRKAIDPNDNLNDNQFIEGVFGKHGSPRTDRFVLAFMEGAQEFFDEVEDHL